MLTVTEAQDISRRIMAASRDEDNRLRRVHDYLKGTNPVQAYVPTKARAEYLAILRRSRVPVLSLVADSLTQNLFVDGYRPARTNDNSLPWSHWQANRMDARQSGVHRSAIVYGASYIVILPGDPAPVWRPVSARRMRAVYADRVNDEWPVYALESWSEGTPDGQVRRLRLYDDEAVYSMTESLNGGLLGGVDVRVHAAGVCPVVRYLGSVDLDGEVCGEIEPLIPLQDQIDASTYYIEMAQQYGVHRQRWVTGMAIPEDDEGNPVEPIKAAIDRLWVGESHDTKFGEFNQTDIKSWLEAREASLRHMAIKSQVPPQDLLGQLVNLSAEALAAAEAGKQRKIGGYKATFGESHEQAFRLDARLSGGDAADDESAQVVWRDTESRSLAQVADALGKMAQMLGIPVRGLWDRIPGVTDQDLQRWEALAAEGDSLAALGSLLNEQAAGVDTTNVVA